jgi:EmrB/QacA subfamily drug resistance transporter
MQTADPKAKAWALALAALASFTMALDTLVTATSLTTIKDSLGAGLAELQWTTNAYNLAFAVLLSVAAALGDRVGRRRIFVAGLAVFVLASIVCALSTNIGMLIAGRALQGAGAAMVVPMGLAILSVAWPAEERGKALGIFGAVTGLAVLSGPVIGGAIAEGIDWTWIFWVNVPVGLVLIPLALSKLGESRGRDTRIDLLGVLLVGAVALGAAWGLMRAADIGWQTPEVVMSLAAAVLLGVALVVWIRLARAPLISPHLFAATGFAPGLAVSFLLLASLHGTLFFVAQFLQVAQGNGPLEAGLRMLPWTATLFIVAPIAGSLVNRFGEKPLVVGGLTLKAAGLAWLAGIAAPDVEFLAMVPPFVLAGIGVSMTIPSVQSAVMRSIGKDDLGKASAAQSMSQFLGSVFGVSVAATVFSTWGSYASPAAFTAGFVAVLATMAILAAAGALSALALAGGRKAGADRAVVSA